MLSYDFISNMIRYCSTRSPHRPCPIGLSLVEIDKIVNSQIFFHGTDMVSESDRWIRLIGDFFIIFIA